MRCLKSNAEITVTQVKLFCEDFDDGFKVSAGTPLL